MRLSRRRFIAISVGVAATGLSASANARPSTWRGVALGAEAKLQLHGVDNTEGQRLIALAVSELNRLENIFSLYRTDSALMRLNRDNLLAEPPFEMLELLSIAARSHKMTDGLFDPTVQPLWQLYAEQAGKPNAVDVSATLKKCGFSKVSIASQEIRFKQPGMALTLNGIAQGYITDKIVALLRMQGLEHAVVNMGEISTIGNQPSGGKWPVQLAMADKSQSFSIGLADKSIATSAPLGTTFDGRASHIIHPKSGKTADNAWQQLSVVHKSAAVADSLSTGLTLMLPEQIAMLDFGRNTKIFGFAKDGAIVKF